MQIRLNLLLTLVLLILSGGVLNRSVAADPKPGRPAGTGGVSGGGVGAIEAVAVAQYDKKLAFAIAGRVGAVRVKPGQTVRAGDPLMELEDDEGKALIGQFEVKAASDVDVRTAEEQLKLAALEEMHLADLIRQNAASPIEHDRAVIKKTLAALDVEKAKNEHLELVQQLEQAKAKHDQYRLLAPVSGVVEEVNFYEGQSVEPAKPVVRLVVIDPLWIDVSVPTQATLALQKDAPAAVRSTLPGYEGPMNGKVIYIAAVADSASTTRLIRVELANPKAMPAGTQVMVEFPSASPEARARP